MAVDAIGSVSSRRKGLEASSNLHAPSRTWRDADGAGRQVLDQRGLCAVVVWEVRHSVGVDVVVAVQGKAWLITRSCTPSNT